MVTLLLFTLEKQVLDENDAEFDFRIGHVLVSFVLMNNKQEM